MIKISIKKPLFADLLWNLTKFANLAAGCFHFYSTPALSSSWQHWKLPIFLSLTLFTFCMSQIRYHTNKMFSSCSLIASKAYIFCKYFFLLNTMIHCFLSFINPFCFRELHHLHERSIRSSLRGRPQYFTMKRYLICVRKKNLELLMTIMWGIGLCDSWMRGKY